MCGAERHHVDAALIDVFFGNEVMACRRRVKFYFILRQFGPFRPGFKCGAQFGFDGRGIKVATDPEDDVIGMNVGLMPNRLDPAG